MVEKLTPLWLGRLLLLVVAIPAVGGFLEILPPEPFAAKVMGSALIAWAVGSAVRGNLWV